MLNVRWWLLVSVDWIMTGFIFAHQIFKRSKSLLTKMFLVDFFAPHYLVARHCHLLLLHVGTLFIHNSISTSRYFEKQFELAHATKLPMFLHMRAAAADFCEIVERNKERLVCSICRWRNQIMVAKILHHSNFVLSPFFQAAR